jgi:hypothetical protein
MLPPIAAIRILRRDRRGSSSPVVVDTDQGLYFVKLRGAAQGVATLVAEVVVAAVADRLGLPVPARRVVTLSSPVPTNDRNDELADLLLASAGENLGFQFLEKARPVHPSDLERVSADFASQVRWLDWLVANPDRSRDNPNILADGPRFWLIDHGAALPFQHDWSSVTEDSPRRTPSPLPHLFDGLATRVDVWDPILTALLPREVIMAAVDQVPDSFLTPLLPAGGPSDMLARRRAAYVAYLWKRLQGPRPWIPGTQ